MAKYSTDTSHLGLFAIFLTPLAGILGGVKLCKNGPGWLKLAGGVLGGFVGIAAGNGIGEIANDAATTSKRSDYQEKVDDIEHTISEYQSEMAKLVESL